MRLFFITLSLLLCTNSAWSESKFYWGASYSYTGDVDEFDGSSVDSSGFNVRLGREFGKFFSVEGQFGLLGDSPASNRLDDPQIVHGDLFLRGVLPYKKVNLYGLIGASDIEIDYGTVDQSDTELAYGAGLELFGNENWAVRFDIIRYDTDDAFNIYSIGFTQRFHFPGFRP